MFNFLSYHEKEDGRKVAGLGLFWVLRTNTLSSACLLPV